jgi:hypothetical protein
MGEGLVGYRQRRGPQGGDRSGGVVDLHGRSQRRVRQRELEAR